MNKIFSFWYSSNTFFLFFPFLAWSFICLIIRSNHRRCSIKETAQRKTLLLESLFHKIAALQVCNFIKKRLQHMCFAVNIAKFLRAPILKNICERLLLYNTFQRLSSVCKSSINLSVSESLSFLLATFWYHMNWFVWCIIF